MGAIGSRVVAGVVAADQVVEAGSLVVACRLACSRWVHIARNAALAGAVGAS